MTVAFVFSGGASLGSIQVGMLRALEEEGIAPDAVFGASVGAMNAAFVAGGGTSEELASIWRGLNGREMFPIRLALGLRAFLGQSNHFVPNSGVRRVLNRHLPFRRLEDAPIPLSVQTTDALTGDEVVLSSGPTVEAILASIALPGVFPPVTIDDRTLIDGGIANNTPINTAIAAGATEVWVLSTGYSCGVAEMPTSGLGFMLHAVALLVQQRLVAETSKANYPVPVHLIPPPCPIMVGPTDFSATDHLIDDAYRGTRQWLSDGMPFALPLIGHRH